jgi:hypothetical protein
MAEVSVFDAYQVQRALRGHLADDDAMEMLARDDATGVYWVLTRRELVLVKDNRIGERIPRERLGGIVDVTDLAVTARVRGSDPRMTLVGTFRKPNRLTRALAEIIGEAPR